MQKLRQDLNWGNGLPTRFEKELAVLFAREGGICEGIRASTEVERRIRKEYKSRWAVVWMQGGKCNSFRQRNISLHQIRPDAFVAQITCFEWIHRKTNWSSFKNKGIFQWAGLFPSLFGHNFFPLLSYGAFCSRGIRCSRWCQNFEERGQKLVSLDGTKPERTSTNTQPT